MSGTSPKTPIGAIGRYQILERIGEGGMGSLYMARDPAIERLLAIKVLRSGFDTDELRERFSREARAAGRLRHPNIVTIFDVGEHDGDPFIAMEFLPGETLGELIRSGARLALTRRLKLLEELCDGLGYAHRAGIVHRDVKPANLMVDSEGTLKILDFGIVRLGDSGMTQAGMLVGTVNYMSPEQVMGGAVDARSDIFAVGAVGYELLAYKQAFPGTLAEGLFNRILNVSVTPLAQLCPTVDSAVLTIIERAMKKDPPDRYQELAKMRNDLARVRQRLEAETDALNAKAGEEAGETIVYSSATPAPSGHQVPPIAEAERAFAKGDFRAALTLAGRSAALNPDDTHASTIVHRAHAALLERGREAETLAGVKPPSTAGGTTPPTATPAPIPTGVETAAVLPTLTPTGSVAAASGSNRMAIVIAGIALVIAAIAVFMRVDRGATPPQQPPSTVQTESPSTSASQPSSASPAVPAPAQPATPAPEPAAPIPAAPEPRAERQPTPQRGTSRPAPAVVPRPSDTPPAVPTPAVRVGGPLRAPGEVAPPRRIRNVEPAYPDSARAQRVQGTVVLELTIGRDGHVADARVVNSIPMLDQAALAAVRQWEYAPTMVDGSAVPVIQTVSVPFALEAVAAPAPPPVDTPRTVPPPVRPVEPPREVPAAPAPPRRDAATDQAGIRETLRRYEAAWEALDFAALSRTRQLSGGESATVRDTMANARQYAVEIAVQDIQVAADGQSATARARVTTSFTPKVGRATNASSANTFQFERRGEGWVIVGIR